MLIRRLKFPLEETRLAKTKGETIKWEMGVKDQG